MATDGTSPETSSLPWWRRPRKLRRQLAGTFVAVALLSVLLVGGLNFVAARQLLDDGTRDQLVGIGEARAHSIELGVDRVLGQVGALAADVAVAEALDDLTEGFAALEEVDLTDDQDEEFEQRYDEIVITPLNEADLGVTVTLGDVAPTDPGRRAAQLAYALVDDADSRRTVADAGDGSDYSVAHARHHAALAKLADTLGLGDLLLVDGSGNVVYSVEKRIDFATNLRTGPHRETTLATTVIDRLARVPVGQAIVSDLELYLPGGAQPVTFAVANVRSGTRLLGAVAVQIPGEGLNFITTADQGWDEVGLSSGESYVVGADRVLLSESRLWIEDPEAYLDRVDAELAARIETLGSPVGLQPVDTEPVDVALERNTFEGTSRNYLGERTFSYSTPIATVGVDWVVVADIPLGEARNPLYGYALLLGIILLVILPVSALVGLWLAGRLTRSIPPVVDAALAVANGDRDPDIAVSGKDEFGDLARRLKQMAAELERQETALAAEFEDRRQLLMTVLPPRLVGTDGAIASGSDRVADATLVAVTVQQAAGFADDTEVARALTDALGAAERLASEHGVERIRGAANHSLFAAGLDADGESADAALAFATALTHELVVDTDRDEIELVVRVGLSSGPVETGMLERGGLTFGVWGEPVRRALAISALAHDEVLVDAGTAASTSERWNLRPVDDVPALDGEPMTLFVVDDGARSS